jgi:hypothetical protein
MITTRLNSLKFEKTMLNVVDYSIGFIDGTKLGESRFMTNLAKGTIDGLKKYIDVNARMSPGALHHIYEWNRIASPSARLYEIKYIVNDIGISFNSTFTQSRSRKSGSSVPFYDKARIMENGIPVTIRPKNKSVLAFEDNGEQVFTKQPVTVENPGGDQVQGSYEKVFDSFFRSYFSQIFLRSSGLIDYLESPKAYKNNFKAGSKQGKSKGIQTGYNWILNATIGVE